MRRPWVTLTRLVAPVMLAIVHQAHLKGASALQTAEGGLRTQSQRYRLAPA